MYCVAASFVYINSRSAINKSDPDQYTNFVDTMGISDAKQTINFQIDFTDITEF